MATICENCGSPLTNDNKFCPGCGAPANSPSRIVRLQHLQRLLLTKSLLLLPLLRVRQRLLQPQGKCKMLLWRHNRKSLTGLPQSNPRNLDNQRSSMTSPKVRKNPLLSSKSRMPPLPIACRWKNRSRVRLVLNTNRIRISSPCFCVTTTG